MNTAGFLKNTKCSLKMQLFFKTSAVEIDYPEK